jgi:hypothetical protein
MERKNELKDIETIISYSKEFKIIENEAIFNHIRLIYLLKKSQNLNYFRFIPKLSENEANKKSFLDFSIELKSLEKTNNFKNYLFGFSAFYLSIIIDKKRNYFGIKTLMKFLSISSIILYQNLMNKHAYFIIMSEIYYKDIKNLKDKIEKEKNGWNDEVIKIFFLYSTYQKYNIILYIKYKVLFSFIFFKTA